MTIGLVCPYNITKGGGVQECVLHLRKELKSRGHEVFILTPQPRNNTSSVPDGVVFIGAATQLKTLHTTSQISVSASNEVIDDVLIKYNFDILHFHEPWVPVVSRQILSRSTCVNIATFHARLPDTVMSKTFEKVITPYTKSILKFIDSYSAVSDAAATYIKSITDQPINIIPNGIDLTKYKNHRINKKTTDILYVGRLEKRKGVKYLIEAFSLLKNRLPETKLIIAGDGPDREKLENYVVENEILDVKFLGQISEEKKLSLLKYSALFCSPALYGESFGIVLLEAMANGLPIVAGDNPGYTSVMQERGLLSLVNPKDTQDFARRLELFLTDKIIRKQWQSWAMKYVEQFDYRKVVDSYEKLYLQSLK
ncbi:MAG: glycosyltransferase family 4 protein [Patescibacteria group bacterium]